MKESYWGYWIILLGIFILGVMLLVNNISTTNTQDYYSVKEVTQAAMVDAVDFSYYRLYGDIKMSEQKFVENFIRRFSENVNLTKTYEVSFYDLYEVPPKVSVQLQTKSNSFNIGNGRNDAYDIVTKMDAILEIGVNYKEGDVPKKIGQRTCVLDITNKLWRFFNGETVDGYNIANTKYDAYNDLKNKKTFTEFRSAFIARYKTRLEKYTSFQQMQSGDPDIVEFINREWIYKS